MKNDYYKRKIILNNLINCVDKLQNKMFCLNKYIFIYYESFLRFLKSEKKQKVSTGKYFFKFFER